MIVSGGIIRVNQDEEVHEMLAPWRVSREVWRLSMDTMQWTRLSDLIYNRFFHSSVVIDGDLITVGGRIIPTMNLQLWTENGSCALDLIHPCLVLAPNQVGSILTSVEKLNFQTTVTTLLPALHSLDNTWNNGFSDGALIHDISTATGETVTLYGGVTYANDTTLIARRTVWDVDLNTGLCTALPSLPFPRSGFTAAIGPHGTIVICGGSPIHNGNTVIMRSSPTSIWTYLPHMNEHRQGARAHMLPNGLLVIGGMLSQVAIALPNAILLDPFAHPYVDPWHWVQGPHNMNVGRFHFASAHIGGCVIVAGGLQNNNLCTKKVEIYRVKDGTFHQLPAFSNLPRPLFAMSCATG
jgi:hypothetical protein